MPWAVGFPLTWGGASAAAATGRSKAQVYRAISQIEEAGVLEPLCAFLRAVWNWITKREPANQVAEAGAELGVDVITPLLGEMIDLEGPVTTTSWWKTIP